MSLRALLNQLAGILQEIHPPLRRELPVLVLEVALLVVLLHANAPEVWFWLVVLLVLLIWRGWAWHWRRQERQGGAAASADGSADGSAAIEAGSSSGSDTGALG